jgi:putative aldouronate transport system substrate-binding protein
MKKVISMVCTLALLLTLLAGCGAANTSTPAETSAAKSEQTTAAKDEPAQIENKFENTVEFSIGTFGAVEEDEFMSFLGKKFNVKIKSQTLDWNNWEQQVNTMMASGDMPDLLQWDYKPFKMKQFKQWVDGGLLKAMPDVSKYPNLQALREKMIIMNNFQIDGKDYLWTKLRGENKWNMTGSLGFLYRKDWAEKLGMAKEEYTVDEFIALAKAFAEKDPAGNGAGKTVGYTDVGWAFPHILNFYNPYAGGVVKKDGKYIWGTTMPETLQGIQTVRRMYKESALWKDFYTAKDYDGKGLYMANRLGIWSDNIAAELSKFRTEFKTANPSADPYKAVAIMKVRGIDGKYFYPEWDNTWSAFVYSSKMSDEEMDRVLAIMDWAAGEEGTRTCQFGFEGTDYEIKDSKVATKWTKNEKGELVKPKYMTTAEAIRNLVSLNGDFMHTDPNLDQQTVSDIVNLYKTATDMPDQITLGKLNYDLDFFSAPNKDKYLGALGSDFRAAVMKIVVSSDDVEGELNKFIKANEAKANSILTELNDAGVK